MKSLPPLLAAVALGLGACATHSMADPPRPPDLGPIAGSPAPPHAALYADCIAQAAARKTFDRNADDSTDLIRFQCDGRPAQLFFEALAAHSGAVGSEWTSNGRTWRSTNKVVRNLFGVDYCSLGAPDDYRCVVTLNTGAFLGAN